MNSTNRHGAPPNLVITADNHGPNLWITTLLGLSLSAVALMTRAIVKGRFDLKRHLDDLFLALGFAICVLQAALVIKALTKNLGTASDHAIPTDVPSMSRLFYASQVVLVCALYFPKIAMVHLLRSVFNLESRLVFLRVIVAALGIASILSIAAGCSPYPGYVLPPSSSRCSGRLVRWSVVATLDIASEIMIMGCYIFFLRNIQMRKTGKIKVMLAICSRSVCIVFALLFITSYSSFLNSSDPGVAVILPAIYQQCNLSSSFILAAILPCFRLLFQSSELIDYPLNPYARNVQRLETPKNNENKSAPAELGIQEK